jgi:hypothetical protein
VDGNVLRAMVIEVGLVDRPGDLVTLLSFYLFIYLPILDIDFEYRFC